MQLTLHAQWAAAVTHVAAQHQVAGEGGEVRHCTAGAAICKHAQQQVNTPGPGLSTLYTGLLLKPKVMPGEETLDAA